VSPSACGGCLGIGSHTRWCPTVRGAEAAILGSASERIEDIADRVGTVDPDIANDLYCLAAKARLRANEESP